MTLTRAKLAVVIIGLLVYIGYLHLQWWDTRMLWRHQSGVRALLADAAESACLTRKAIQNAADERGWPHRTGEFIEYEYPTDSFREGSYSPDALHILIAGGVPFSGEPETVFLFDEDD